MPEVTHAPDRNRFEVQEGDDVAFLDYELGDGRVAFLHTIVPDAMGGKGVAGRLAETGVRWARESGLEVDPVCTYVQGWLAKHPEALADQT